MNCGLLFCFLLSHLISDFVLQSNSIVEQRYSSSKKTRKRANLKHAARYFVISFILTSYYLSVWTVLGTIALAILHFFIDKCKTDYTAGKPAGRYELVPFLLDQFAHLVSIAAVTVFVSYILPEKLCLESIFQHITAFAHKCTEGISYADKVVLSALLFVLGVWGVGTFIRLFFNRRKYRNGEGNLLEKPDDNGSQKIGTEDGGYTIGILERIFIICAIVIGIKEVIGFVLATKSIARFKKFDDDRFVENFIIGSFMSFISAIIIGIIIRTLNIYNVIVP